MRDKPGKKLLNAALAFARTLEHRQKKGLEFIVEQQRARSGVQIQQRGSQVVGQIRGLDKDSFAGCERTHQKIQGEGQQLRLAADRRRAPASEIGKLEERRRFAQHQRAAGPVQAAGEQRRAAKRGVKDEVRRFCALIAAGPGEQFGNRYLGGMGGIGCDALIEKARLLQDVSVQGEKLRAVAREIVGI
jgi:hypothetical protein